MKISTVNDVRYIIELNSDEAQMLREMVQNPAADNESPTEASFRGDLFHKLAPVVYNHPEPKSPSAVSNNKFKRL